MAKDEKCQLRMQTLNTAIYEKHISKNIWDQIKYEIIFDL